MHVVGPVEIKENMYEVVNMGWNYIWSVKSNCILIFAYDLML